MTIHLFYFSDFCPEFSVFRLVLGLLYSRRQSPLVAAKQRGARGRNEPAEEVTVFADTAALLAPLDRVLPDAFAIPSVEFLYRHRSKQWSERESCRRLCSLFTPKWSGKVGHGERPDWQDCCLSSLLPSPSRYRSTTSEQSHALSRNQSKHNVIHPIQALPSSRH